MRKFLCLALGVVATLTAMVGCAYDDDAIWQRIDNLEEQVEQNRADIATLTALMEAMDEGKVILSTEYTEEGVVLTFSDGTSVTIKNGKDGNTGEQGEQGEQGDSLFISIEECEDEVIITLADGRVIRLAKSSNENKPEPEEPEAPEYELRTLSFEQEQWNGLIDEVQYGGSLLYADSGEYSWHDEGNTELCHSFVTPYWTGGHAISNYAMDDYTTLPEGYYGWYELQLSVLGGGCNGSRNFAVHNGYADFYNSQIYDASLQTLEFADGVERVVESMWVTNTCYMLNSLSYGDGFNSPATEESFVKVVAYGYNSLEEEVGKVEFMLCDGIDNIVSAWTKWELSSLGKVAKIAFNFEASSDQIGDYGMNCPAYFAYDDVVVRFEK
ncbi:MAG: DUF4465 domain-containing protein [Alistipes sp.]|nr:DUF4465 domain-containing protein [Alistipes sp.]